VFLLIRSLIPLFNYLLAKHGRGNHKVGAFLQYFSDAILFKDKTIKDSESKAEDDTQLTRFISETLEGVENIIRKGYEYLLPSTNDPPFPNYFNCIRKIYDIYYSELSIMKNIQGINQSRILNQYSCLEYDLKAELIKTFLLLQAIVLPHLYLTTQLIPLLSGNPTYTITTYYNIKMMISDLEENICILKEIFMKCPSIDIDNLKNFVKNELKSNKIKEYNLKVIDSNTLIREFKLDKSSVGSCVQQSFQNVRKELANNRAYIIIGRNRLVLETSVEGARHLMNITHGILPFSSISLEASQFYKVVSAVFRQVTGFSEEVSNHLETPKFTSLFKFDLPNRVSQLAESAEDDETKNKLNGLNGDLNDLYKNLEEIIEKHCEASLILNNLRNTETLIKK